jgi:phosphatidylglycerol---prolipoprotein diacylglyceryl transferase
MFYWNPNPVAFNVPFFNIPIFIYGICFVTGFFLGYLLLVRLMDQQFKETNINIKAQILVDQLTWFVIGGTIIGARLGHVLFYDLPRYLANPLLILNTREGGLASHGGTIGILLAMAIYYIFIFRKKTPFSFLQLLDMVVVPAALAAVFIRLGNFFNQEIIGTPTNMPWAVIFGSPADHAPIVPRHPAQVYEGLAYLAIFALLMLLWRFKKTYLRPGLTAGIFFTLVFGSRFLIEYVKAPLDSILDQSALQAGQTLSIPFIILGICLIGWSFKRENQLS